MTRTLLVALLLMAGAPAFAQSSLGITGASLSLGVIDDEAGDARTSVAAKIDVAITAAHGFQGDLAYADTANGAIGLLGAHLYMTPKQGQKYGLFATVADIDGRSMVWGTIGAEAMFSLGQSTVLEGRAGIGVADTRGLDFIFGGISIAHQIAEGLELETALDLADFDEAGFRATSYDLGATARYSPAGAPWGVYAGITRSGMSGRDGANGETRLALGVTVTLGQSGGVDPKTRPFRSVDPVAPLIRRGLW